MAKRVRKSQPVRGGMPAVENPRKSNVIHFWQTPDKGEFFWHVLGKNGKVVAIGGESFKRKAGVLTSKYVMALSNGLNLPIEFLGMRDSGGPVTPSPVEPTPPIEPPVEPPPTQNFGPTPVDVNMRIGRTEIK